MSLRSWWNLSPCSSLTSPKLREIFLIDWIKSGVWCSCCIQVSQALWAIFGKHSYSFFSLILPRKPVTTSLKASHASFSRSFIDFRNLLSLINFRICGPSETQAFTFFVASCRKHLSYKGKNALLSSRPLINCFIIPSFRCRGGIVIWSRDTRGWFSMFGSPG